MVGPREVGIHVGPTPHSSDKAFTQRIATTPGRNAWPQRLPGNLRSNLNG